jgi:hypothetical protein
MVGLPACLKVFLFFKTLQTNCGAHTDSYSVNLRCSFAGGKIYRHEADRCTPSNAGIMKEWSCINTSSCTVLPCTGPDITILTPETYPTVTSCRHASFLYCCQFRKPDVVQDCGPLSVGALPSPSPPPHTHLSKRLFFFDMS